MIAFLIPYAIKLVGPRFAKPLIYAGMVMLAVGAFFIAKAIYDRSVIDRHESKQLEQSIKRERKANAEDEIRRRDDEAAAERLESEVDNAIAKHPEEAGRSSGPASATALRELRRRQAERR